MNPKDKAEADKKATLLLTIATLTSIEQLSSQLFTHMHGHKMDGPRNEVERALIVISHTSEKILNQLTNNTPIEKVRLDDD